MLVVKVFDTLLKNYPFHPILWILYYVYSVLFPIKPNIPVKDKSVSAIRINVPIDDRYLQRIIFLKNDIYCLVFIKGNVAYKIPKNGVYI